MNKYNLSIEVKCNLSRDNYTQQLELFDIPRGIPLSTSYHIKNICNTDFSGTLTEVNILFDKIIAGRSYGIRDIPNIPITNLKPQESRKIYEREIRFSIEGTGLVECMVKPYNNEDTIEYFADDGKQPLRTPSWTEPFYVISKEQIVMIELLKEIRENIKELLNKSKY